ncbi:MAG TPA: DUF1657 domain-containing protein [Syntrophomonadaceae bacterium]|nr:DUF1657 domain-containing protein [Syntrophomonadaceae bacterium]
MTVKSDLKKAVAAAMAAKGSYLTAAESTQDPSAKNKYEEMAMDADKHVEFLNSRIQYLTDNTLL